MKEESDKYFGYRVHCWVLVLPPKREIEEPLFIGTVINNIHVHDIANTNLEEGLTTTRLLSSFTAYNSLEPSTGRVFPAKSVDHNYFAIESLWNHANYWVNMQDTRGQLFVCSFFFLTC